MRSPNAKNTGFQYTPVDSMPASSTRSATSQSPSSSNPPAVVGNVRVATRRDRPAPGVRTVTTTVTVHIQPRAALDQLLHHIHPDIGIPVPVFGHRDAVGVQSCQSRSQKFALAAARPGAPTPRTILFSGLAAPSGVSVKYERHPPQASRARETIRAGETVNVADLGD